MRLPPRTVFILAVTLTTLVVCLNGWRAELDRAALPLNDRVLAR
jgi:hypothetical protein